MRVLFALALVSVLTTACATQSPPTAATPAAKAEAKPAAAAAQCWSSDHNKFFDIGSKIEVAGKMVECKATQDPKWANWSTGGH